MRTLETFTRGRADGRKRKPAAAGQGRGVSRLLSPAQVAATVGLERDAIYRAISRGELEAFKPCGRLRVPEPAIDAWLNATRVKPTRASDSSTAAPQQRPRSVELGEDSFRARVRRRKHQAEAQAS